MNYQKVYDSIITRAKSRTLTIYSETHHIIPRCLGGLDSKENLVVLTAREHFICHWLLARIYPKNRKLAYAFFAMCNQKSKNQQRYVPSSRIYEEARSNYSSLGFSEEHKNQIAASRRGKKTIVHPITKDIKYCTVEELPGYLEQGWKNTNLSKGKTGLLSEQGKQKLAEARKRDQTGKVGDQAKASKGWVVCEYEDGTKIEAGSLLQLSYMLKIPSSTAAVRLNKFPDTFKKGYKIYYKNSN